WANQALGGRGGALRAVTLDLGHCTLVDNSPSGVELVRERGASAQAQVNDSALVGNGSGDLVLGEGVVLVRSRHSVYGTLRGGASGATDRVGVERSQLALAATPERYGQVRVLPLEPGSVLIDSGDPAAAGAPAFDARGAPYARVRDGGTAERLDVGAFEVQRPFPKVVETLEPTLAGPSAVLGDDEAPPAAAVEPQDAPARVTGLSKADATQKALAGPSPSADPPAPPAAQGAAPLQAGRTFEDRSAEAAPSAPAPPRRSPYLHQGSMNAIRNLR
ncbi:MAG: hypothetical protein KDD82_18400, partial [Planctomycetes bacterium]|nr:hypothetical protein [Planctomycetota bacterium]